MTSYDSILSAANQMPVADRLRLIDELAAALSDDQPPTLSPEWLSEIDRRSKQLDSDQVQDDSPETAVGTDRTRTSGNRQKPIGARRSTKPRKAHRAHRRGKHQRLPSKA